MPQLSTLFIFMIYFWTWFVLCLISQKTKTTLISKTPMKVFYRKPKNSPLTPPWA